MGVLRSDIISHSQLGGPGGSVQFDGSDDALKTADSDTYALKTNDFTIECWLYSTSDNAYDCWFSNDDYASGTGGIALYKNNSQLTAIVNPSGGQIFDGHGTVSLNTWHHVAFVRQSGNYRYYLNGEIIGESDTQGSYNLVGNSLIIGANNYGNAYPAYEWPGYISNVRVVNGRAVYGPGNFTVPKFKLKNIPGTVLLCCQSSSSTTEAAVGDGALSASSAPVASGFAPDLKEDITDTGVVFADNTKFDTLSYMVPPGGRTRDRYLKSTGDIVSGNLIWHIDAGNTTSYAGVTTSGTTIYDLKAGSGMNGTVGIATLASGHADFPAPGWTPDNGGAWYLASDSNLASPSNTGQHIIMPYVNLGNDNYTINVWVKLQYYSEQSDGFSYLVTNKDGSPVSYHAHIKEVSGQGRIGGGAYYTGWTYDYASDADENTMIALNKWYMLTWVNTAQYTQSMYVNGVRQKLNGGAYTWNSRSSNSTPVNATSYANNETTNGWIGQIQYYSDTLTADEILQNYNAHKCRYDQ